MKERRYRVKMRYRNSNTTKTTWVRATSETNARHLAERQNKDWIAIDVQPD